MGKDIFLHCNICIAIFFGCKEQAKRTQKMQKKPKEMLKAMLQMLGKEAK
jgi:heterodisulfide reductase subunit B